MATIEQALYEYVRNAATLLPLLAGRVYPVLAPPQAALPYLLYTELFYSAEHYLGGAATLAHALVQWDAYAAGHQQARAVGHALTTLLDGCHGLCSGVDIRRVTVEARRTSLEPAGNGGQSQYYRVSIDTEVWYLI